MADIRKAQQQLQRFIERSPEWDAWGGSIATTAQKDGERPAVRYMIGFASYAEMWRADVTINGTRVHPPRSMRSGGFYATPAQAAKGCEAMERSQYS